MNDTLFSRFLRHPTQVGAFCASSRFLTRAMTSGIGIEHAKLVVELGAGTGVLTREILKKKTENGQVMAIELDDTLANGLEQKFPQALIARGCASNLGSMLQERALPNPEVIVSGLPWAIFSLEMQEKIICNIVEQLAPGGYFSTFAYLQGVLLPAGFKFRHRLKELFAEVDTSEIVWRNFPPAFVYKCKK